jgi:flagellar assembly protein FliH
MPVPVKAFEYPRAFSTDRLADAMSEDMKPEPETARPSPAVPSITESDVAAAHEQGRKEGYREAEQLFGQQLAQAVSTERARVSKMVEDFQQSSSDYYSKVEDQVVHLALGIAAKILHRESQVDPLLVAALVRLATENLKQGSKVQVNIHPQEISAWRSYFEREGNSRVNIELAEDPTLLRGECTVHSEVGIAALGIDAQLKEIERGLFDLLNQRPKNE